MSDRQLQSGETAYIVENNHVIRPCRILRISGGFATIAFSRESATRLRLDRLFPTKEEAVKHILK